MKNSKKAADQWLAKAIDFLMQVLRSFDLKCRVGRLAIYNQYQLATSVDDPG
jgi:hypothetical protein